MYIKNAQYSIDKVNVFLIVHIYQKHFLFHKIDWTKV